ncbi:microtubule-associated tumor suppressor 1 homolog isoform X1 [Xiphophorus hellerii]|uniref:microtubule-associated tumor suppressor 1 homolog isoform X1 n=1 Tax=Xiphophorus hellerii TaxID=8084 RepID=UPI0013B3CF80|nr:microtubule-associated tumor suppressor 1 homolog isoform X1 [Xiphophorus hellerii]XP_032418700.1 microtubule-associated tumor suppressor 1 homolog isoform X1 [Xiphophorus hellerii]XP_032418701.1 microtubule-associated tumor suppressor 1 homolog isoform X1 [Xiphophorus hellerii]
MSSMKLPLCRQGDHNGNAFPVSSSSSSSSPESLRSLSGGRTESPLEYDLLAVTMTTAVMPAHLEEVVLSRWAPEEEEDEEGRFQTDASASLYLDASSAGFHQDTWSPRLDGYRGNGSCSADSDTTETPADDDEEDEEDEALFVSVSSDVCVTLSQVSPAGAGAGPDLQDGGSDPVRAAELPRGDPDSPDRPAASQNRSRTSSTSSDPVGGAVPPQEVHVTRTGPSGSARTSSLETKGTQNPSPSRTPTQQNQPEPRRRAEVVGSRRPTPGPVKVARLHRPSRGKGAATRADHQEAAASLSAPPEKKKAAESRAASSSSVGSDPVREAATQTAQEKLRTPSKRAASRPPGRSGRPDRAPAPPAEPDSAGAEADRPATRNQNQNQGIPKPRASGVAHSPTASIPKPSSNQQSAPGSAWRPPAPAASRLPVKGVPAGMSYSSLGSSENNAASSKAAGSKPDEPPSRGSSSTSAPSAPSDGSSCFAPKPPAAALKGRALSLQARATTGLKSLTGTNQNSIRTPGSQPAAKAAPSGSAKPPLQRNGSTRLSRLNSTVDKNKPREAPTRPASGGSQITTGNQQNLPAEPVPDVLNANSPVTPALPVPCPDGSSATSGSAAPTGPGLKARTGSRSSPKHGLRPQHASRPGAAPAKQNQNKEQAERKNQAIVQLRRLLVQGNRKVEALAAVIQHLFSEREETLKKKKDLSSELEKLRADLAASAQRCQNLQADREEVRSNLEEALRRAEEQHQEELVQLENRLKSFYQAEWDKVHQLYQEEADKCRLLMEQQVEELRSRQEVERRKQEESHSQKMEAVKQEYNTSIQELRRVQVTELEDLQKTLMETETSLAEKISLLSAENENLSEKLRAEEERRQRILSDKSLKDSHTLYLEQELDSLKVVLEIKNQQLHQKEKKLMEMDKMVETNVRLEECLKKVQQENEDYKARMDKHAALSKQLSSEQAILQQTLQKESKVNKRLSMENEELLWKLHNGDLLGSPRRLTPPSPCGSPRDSAHFPTAAPLSPR